MDSTDCTVDGESCYSSVCSGDTIVSERDCLTADDAATIGGCNTQEVEETYQRCTSNSDCTDPTANCCASVTCISGALDEITESVCVVDTFMGSVAPGCYITNQCIQDSTFNPYDYPCDSSEQACGDYDDLVGFFCCSNFSCDEDNSHNGQAYCYPQYSSSTTSDGCTAICADPFSTGCVYGTG